MREIRRARGSRRCGIALALAIAIAAYAQQTGAGIQGRVMDESGAVVPAAVVTITGANGFTRQLSTDGTGAYAIKGLAQGQYVVHVAQPGFARFESPAMELTAGPREMNVQLKLLAAQQRITV